MSSSAPRSGERNIHQDFIARIRYSNALPPPPNPPKLLDIPNTGLASGQYTNPSFASRLVREQPLNIEADAELGMPLDLVGMPGIFDGDESSIQAPATQPHVHPHDRALLRPLSTLGRSKGGDTSVSFLRRTEYISSVASKRGPSSSSAFLKPKIKRPEKRVAQEVDIGSPAAIRRKIEKSFEVAQRYIKEPRSLQHPSKKPGLSIVESRPFLPDLDAFPDLGAYVTIKLQTNPVSTDKTYDDRLLSAILQPISKTSEEEEAFAIALEDHNRDPDNFPRPSNLLDYHFFLPISQQTGERFRSAFDIDNPERDSPELYTHSSNALGGPCFRFTRLRSYETTKETEIAAADKYTDELIVNFNDQEGPIGDGGDVVRQRAAYFYPVIQRATIRPQRAKNILRSQSQIEDDKEVATHMDVALEDPEVSFAELAAKYKANPYLGHAEATEDPNAEEADETVVGKSGRGDADDEMAGARTRASRSPSEQDGDAEGEED
ncbi:hypothetical protein ACHAQH_006412 [Verticillium albo-atrum]